MDPGRQQHDALTALEFAPQVACDHCADPPTSVRFSVRCIPTRCGDVPHLVLCPRCAAVLAQFAGIGTCSHGTPVPLVTHLIRLLPETRRAG